MSVPFTSSHGLNNAVLPFGNEGFGAVLENPHLSAGRNVSRGRTRPGRECRPFSPMISGQPDPRRPLGLGGGWKSSIQPDDGDDWRIATTFSQDWGSEKSLEQIRGPMGEYRITKPTGRRNHEVKYCQGGWQIWRAC